jgi:DNA-binding IclR family transcriptional regulator
VSTTVGLRGYVRRADLFKEHARAAFLEEMHMTCGRTIPWRRLPELARQLGITNTSACRCAYALARRDRATQTATGRWYVDPAAFTEQAMHSVRKLRARGPV